MYDKIIHIQQDLVVYVCFLTILYFKYTFLLWEIQIVKPEQ